MADVTSKMGKITLSQNERSIRRRQCFVNYSTNRKKKKAGHNQDNYESIDKRIGAVGIKVEINRSDTAHKEIVSPIEHEIVKFKKRKLGRRNKEESKEENSKIKMCRLCLSSDIKMWSIYDHNFAFLYTIFTGFNVSVEDGHPQHVCWECAARLRSSFRFRERALQAQNIVASLLDMTQPTDEVLEKIDRVGTDLSLSQIEFYYVGNERIDNTSEMPEANVQNVPSPTECEQYSDAESDDFIKSTTEEDSKPKEEDLEEDYKDPLQDKDVQTDIVQSKEVIEKNSDVESIGRRTVVIPKQCRQKATIKQFEITMLSVEEQLIEFEKRKKWRNYITMKYKCDKCYKAFNHEEQYEAHKNKHTNRHGSFVCNICSLHFFTERGIKTHLKKHSVKYKCRRCSFVSFSWGTAKCHNHSGKKYKCPHCFEVYDVYTSYLGHIRRTHALSVVCARCGQAFLTSLGLQLHNKLKHKYDDKLLENGPHCDECDMRFATQQAFDTHLKTSAKHSSGREAKRRIKNNSSVIENKLNSTILCELCNEQLADSKAYATHFKDRHPGKNRTYYPSMKSPHMCDVCGKMFQSMCALKEHVKVVHTGVEYRCGECGKRFSTKHVLRNHAAKHERGGLACPRCGRSMANKGNLKRHMFTVHSGQRPFKCESCGKAFADNNSKKTHVEYVHNKKPWPKRDRSKRNRRQVEEQVLPNPSESAAQDTVFIQEKSYMEE